MKNRTCALRAKAQSPAQHMQAGVESAAPQFGALSRSLGPVSQPCGSQTEGLQAQSLQVCGAGAGSPVPPACHPCLSQDGLSTTAQRGGGGRPLTHQVQR